MTDLLERADKALERVKVFRKIGQYVRGLEALQPRIEELEAELSSIKRRARTLDLLPDEIEFRNQVATKLSDAYGVRGGLLRRSGALQEALSSYGRGREIEQCPDYGISDSYNVANEILLSILSDPAKVNELQPKIRAAVATVRAQVEGDRANQWWAWADLGMLSLLGRRPDDAKRAYAHFWETGARDVDFNSSRMALEDCRDALRNTDPALAQSIEAMIATIVDLRPLDRT